MVYELSRKIRKCDVQILCHSYREGNTLEEKIENEIPVTYLNQNGRSSFRTFVKNMKILTKINPDVIHAHMGVAAISIIWCWIHHKKCVITIHTRPDMAFSKLNQKIVRYALKKKKVTVVAVSKQNQELCRSYYNEDDITFINNGIDIDRYYKKHHDQFTFIHVARQDRNKNAKFIIECFDDLLKEGYDARLLLLGDGPEHNTLIQQVNELGLNKYIKLVGNVSDTWNYFSISDCFLLASHREALPMTAIEALATGIPIISTDVGGLRDIVKGNGKIVSDNDKTEYKKAMISALKNKFRNTEEISKILVKEFSSMRMAEEYEHVYFG